MVYTQCLRPFNMSLVKSLSFDKYVVVASAKCSSMRSPPELLECLHQWRRAALPRLLRRNVAAAERPNRALPRVIGDEYRLCCVRVACADHCSHMCLNELELMCFGPPPHTVSGVLQLLQSNPSSGKCSKRGTRTLPTMDAVEKMRVVDPKQLRLTSQASNPGSRPRIILVGACSH